MKIIILAAGKGERLMPLTRNTPKPLLDMGNGLTLIEEQLASLRDSRIVDEVVLVIGHLAEQIEAKIKTYDVDGLRVRTVFNPFYAISNNLMSLWLARHEMTSDFLITNGDNLFTPGVFSDFCADTREGIWLATSEKGDYDFDDMKVSFDEGAIRRVRKEIEADEIDAESPGLCLVRGERARSIFVDHLELLARHSSSIDRYWLEVFNCLYERGVLVRPWTFDAASKWQEVDFHVDVDRMRELVRGSVRELKVASAVDAALRADSGDGSG